MPIRREDKDFIQSLSLFGALFGACLGFWAVMHLSDRARQTYLQQTEELQTHAALVRLNSTLLKPDIEPIVDKEVLNQVQEQFQEPAAVPSAPVKSFWLQLPRWGYWGLCAGGGLVGVVAGYSSIWVTGWAGSIFVYHLIRLLYKSIRKIAPHSEAAKIIHPENAQSHSCGITYQRDDTRLFPMLVKLFFLLLFVLCILAAVVWHVTAP